MSLKSSCLARVRSRVIDWWRLVVRGRVGSYSPLTFNDTNRESVKAFVVDWNESFPIDHWWREKYNVPFNSERHREVSFIDMRFEWEEDKLYKKLRDDSGYKPNAGEFFKRVENEESHLTEQEQMKQFMEEEQSMDYSQYDDR